MVHRYEDAQQMLRDNETFSSSIIIQAFGDVFGKHVMLGMDEPEHGRHRALVSKAFSQKALVRWEDELVGTVGNELIDAFANRGNADLVKEFNFPYPTRIIADPDSRSLPLRLGAVKVYLGFWRRAGDLQRSDRPRARPPGTAWRPLPGGSR